MLKEDLKQLGLREKEAELYLALLEAGEANIQDLVEKAGIKRTSVYHLLEYLKEKGFVGVTTKKKRKLYFAQDPRKLESDLDERRSIVRRVVPELLSMANFIQKKPIIRYFEGMEGIKEIYKEYLSHHEQEILSWWPEEESYTKTIGDNFFFEYYMPERLKHRIFKRVIAPNTKYFVDLERDDTKQLRKTKLIDLPEGEHRPIEVSIFGGGKIALLSFNEKFGLILESKDVYDNFKSLFESQWKMIPDKNNNYRSEE